MRDRKSDDQFEWEKARDKVRLRLGSKMHMMDNLLPALRMANGGLLARGQLVTMRRHKVNEILQELDKIGDAESKATRKEIAELWLIIEKNYYNCAGVREYSYTNYPGSGDWGNGGYSDSGSGGVGEGGGGGGSGGWINCAENPTCSVEVCLGDTPCPW